MVLAKVCERGSLRTDGAIIYYKPDGLRGSNHGHQDPTSEWSSWAVVQGCP